MNNIPSLPYSKIEPIELSTRWRSPSNIALVKYWGKRDNQIPQNASLSFSLNASYTDTEVQIVPKTESHGELISVQLFLDGERNQKFEEKIIVWFKQLLSEAPYLSLFHWEIKTSNTFPHSSGIASSASGMSALALCLTEIESKLYKAWQSPADFYRRASYLARLGSGSASRSVYGGYAVWGKHHGVYASTDEYAVPLHLAIHPDFAELHNSILIVSRAEKSVSSRAGHSLMNNHPYAAQRYAQANQNLMSLLKTMQDGNFNEFANIVENEALTLHALMMSSVPSFILLQPSSLQIIQKIRSFREKYAVPVCFTIDAGPNIHMLYPTKARAEVLSFIQHELIEYCDQQMWIDDKTGTGPVKVIL